MADHAYANRTLVGNWYEDRLIREQAFKKHPNEFLLRDEEEGISGLAGSHLPKSLGRIKRRYKWNTEHIIADDGFRELGTINKTELGKPDMELVKEKPTEKLIRKENLSDLLRKPRDIVGPESGFGSKLARHEPLHDKRYFGTTYGEFHGNPLKESAKVIVQEFQKTFNIVAGKEPSPKKKERDNVPLVGEMMRKNYDPQHDTEAQRTWINKVDSGINAVQTNKVPKGQTKYDNALSLPLGEGYRAEMPISTEQGAYRKIRQDVTLAPQWNCSSRFK